MTPAAAPNAMKMPAPVGFFGFFAIRRPCHVPKWSASPSRPGTAVPSWHLVNAGFIIATRTRSQSAKLARNLNSLRWGTGALALYNFPFVADRGAVTDAYELMDRFGADAGVEAAARADASRNRGNVTSFCRWRQIERMIVALGNPYADGTRH